jgi:hypothetical protein
MPPGNKGTTYPEANSWCATARSSFRPAYRLNSQRLTLDAHHSTSTIHHGPSYNPLMRRRWKALAGFELIVLAIVAVGLWLSRPVVVPFPHSVTLFFPVGFKGAFRLTPEATVDALREQPIFNSHVLKVDADGTTAISKRDFGLLQPPTEINYLYLDETKIENSPDRGLAWAESKLERDGLRGVVHAATPKPPVKLN